MKKTDPQCKKRLKTTSEICVLFRHRPQNLKETSKTCNLQAQNKKKKLKKKKNTLKAKSQLLYSSQSSEGRS